MKAGEGPRRPNQAGARTRTPFRSKRKMRANLLKSLLLFNAALALASGDAFAQPRRPFLPPATPGAPVTPPPAPAPAGGTPPDPGAASGGPGAPATPGGKAGATGPGGKSVGDTTGLSQFETGVEFEPRAGNDRVSFSLEDADLPDLVRVIGELTGKRFIFGGKVHNIKASVFSPQKVTVAEAYQAFLSILEANGLTVVPHGRFYKIVDSPDAKMGAPVYVAGQGGTTEERYITRIHRLRNVSADEVANVLGHFKSKDGDITVYGPGNLLIITDTGTNIQRMMRILEDVDVGGVGDQIWIQHLNYALASDAAARLEDVFDIKAQGGGGGGKGGEKGAAPAVASGSDAHVTKIVADDRSNSLVIVATERAYQRMLEFIKRLDVPATVGEGEIHVVLLQHADAVEMAKTLSEIVTGAAAAGTGGGTTKASAGSAPLEIFESKVKVSADKATNSIVVTSSLRDFANLRTVIDQLDKARRQVFIEAVVMDLTIDRQNQLGVAFHGAAGANSPVGEGQSILYGGLNPFRTIGLPSPTDTTLSAFALGVRGPGVPGTENLLGTGISLPAYGILINALASTNDSDTLATPHILATDNVPATISVGQNIPLQTNAPSFGGLPGATGAAAGALGGLGGFGLGTTPRQDIGTKVKITPHLNDSDEVRLEVSEEISDVAGQQPLGSLGAIPFAKRTAETTLVVKDQQTAIIGGLVRNHVARTETKIPLLGDIPVLGMLFRSSSSDMMKSNLILILTPYIIREQDDLRKVYERKMQERQEFLVHYFVFAEQNTYEPPKDYSRTNGALELIRQSYLNVDEDRRIEELKGPREIRTQGPVQPLELPAPIGAENASPGAPSAAGPGGAAPKAAPAPPSPGDGDRAPSQINVTPPPRNVERIER
jgi:general secretion pathway protein D